MNDRLAGALRQTFDEIADAGPPPQGLARAALAGARRSRRGRVGGAVALALCAALASGVAVSGLGEEGGQGGQGQAGQGGPPLNAPGDAVVMAYSGVRDLAVEDGSPAFNYSLLLDRATGKYERIAYRYAMPSPDGERVLVAVGDNSAPHPSRVGIMNRATGSVRWFPDIPGTVGDGVWSPDGKRVAFRNTSKSGPITALVADAETLTSDEVPLPDFREGDVRMRWTPDSAGFAITLARSPDEATAAQASEVRYYGLDGKQRHSLPVPDASFTAAPAFSAGGQLAVSGPKGGDGPLEVAIVDPQSGAVHSRFTLAESGAIVDWVGEAHLLVRTFGRQAEQLKLVGLDGVVVKELTPPEDVFAQQIFVGPADGLPDSAADLTF
ncbi:hypothetical protein SAMN05421812_11044 [Asanoa hainanensis]|uniref:WD40-like Beta Propeller Repeat n=1 Tax=Asanoa hainanensis TaxID=560556 RepID=A0A239NPM9_9ACTN|nr:hypothetical protein [Asanoa hainanensis]SNT56871.1 hypothetical protein SAMN05421812_11044 [Asanoa hainanensis]